MVAPTVLSTVALDELRSRLTAVAVPGDALRMSAYMKDRFDFIGVKAAARRSVCSPVLAAARHSDQDALLAFAYRCWSEREREFHYLGADVLRAGHLHLDPTALDDLATLITTHSWWDTVDTLASWPVGSVVMRHDEAAAVMDVWVHSDDIWIARAAILHQLRANDDTDVDRLFSYALARASDSDIFIRKAIGWSLRQYARRDPAAILRFVKTHEAELSNLTRRETLKNIE